MDKEFGLWTNLSTIDGYEGLPQIDDARLVQAAFEALETGKLMPLIKEELRCTIQTRRLTEGKEELNVNFTEPLEMQLRPDEIDKRERRREQNRRAAKKAREKKKMGKNKLLTDYTILQSHNSSLVMELQSLAAEKFRLCDILKQHEFCHLNAARAMSPPNE